jgi:hypothetical protein
MTSFGDRWSFNIATPGMYEVQIVPNANYKTTAPAGGLFIFDLGKASARINNIFIQQKL